MSLGLCNECRCIVPNTSSLVYCSFGDPDIGTDCKGWVHVTCFGSHGFTTTADIPEDLDYYCPKHKGGTLQQKPSSTKPAETKRASVHARPSLSPRRTRSQSVVRSQNSASPPEMKKSSTSFTGEKVISSRLSLPAAPPTRTMVREKRKQAEVVPKVIATRAERKRPLPAGSTKPSAKKRPAISAPFTPVSTAVVSSVSREPAPAAPEVPTANSPSTQPKPAEFLVDIPAASMVSDEVKRASSTNSESSLSTSSISVQPSPVQEVKPKNEFVKGQSEEKTTSPIPVQPSSMLEVEPKDEFVKAQSEDAPPVVKSMAELRADLAMSDEEESDSEEDKGYSEPLPVPRETKHVPRWPADLKQKLESVFASSQQSESKIKFKFSDEMASDEMMLDIVGSDLSRRPPTMSEEEFLEFLTDCTL